MTCSTAATPGTGLSIGQGLATARDLRRSCERIAVVVGDAAITSGLSLEALNDIGQRKTQLLIVLNDNEMSISPTVGGLSKYLSQIKLSRHLAVEQDGLRRARRPDPGRRPDRPRAQPAPPRVGRELRPAGPAVRGPRDHLHRRSCRATTSRRSSRRFQQALELRGPVIVHVRTQKGHGFRPAEADQVGFHGAALPPMTVPPPTRRQRQRGDRRRRETGRPRRRRCRPSRWPTTPRPPSAVAAAAPRTRTTPRSSPPS